MMNIQIFGTKKCPETRKAERFFSERGVKFHFRDLGDRDQLMKKGELDNILRSVSAEDLINREGKQYQKRNMQFMVFNIEEELLGDQLLFRFPIVRNGKNVTVGYEPDQWQNWINEDKGK